MTKKRPLLLIACGALAHEVMAVLRMSGLEGIEVQCLPAKLHNTPHKIPEAVRAKIREERPHFERIFVLYGDCGTGGLLDDVLAEEGVERIAGAHCYEFFAGTPAFNELAEEEAGSFYLTDFLARHFERLIMQGLGINRHPELLPLYFGNYKRVVYLAQTDSRALREKAKLAAERLGLAYEYRFTGYGDLRPAISAAAASSDLLPIRAAAAPAV
ncbi:MAG TPA: DUF1638 domain-containing protein [Stellaceae bacterium]|nr:DUF1638 domain-containing protein [Stellaceae bacterium]